MVWEVAEAATGDVVAADLRAAGVAAMTESVIALMTAEVAPSPTAQSPVATVPRPAPTAEAAPRRPNGDRNGTCQLRMPVNLNGHSLSGHLCVDIDIGGEF